MKFQRQISLLALCCASLAATAWSADMRDRVRLAPGTGTSVSETQASDLSLTLTTVQVQSVQRWVRTSGTLDTAGSVLTFSVTGAEAATIASDQRVRAYPANSKSSMFQARITGLETTGDGVSGVATLSSRGLSGRGRYLLEIVVDLGNFLSIPNEAIIEEGDSRVVYVPDTFGGYEPREVVTGVQGERFTQVLEGLEEGEQVVTTGSFFIDADYKMKGGG